MSPQSTDNRVTSHPRWRNSTKTLESVSNSNSNTATIENRFVTVAIPDVRDQSDFFVTAPVARVSNSVEEDVAENALPKKTGPSSSLRAIKNAIERTLDGKDSLEFNQSIDELLAAVPAPTRSKHEVAESDEVSDGDDDRTIRNRKTTKLPEHCAFSRLNSNDSQIKPICDSILERTPGCGAKIVTFASSEENEQLATTVMNTAVAIGAKNLGRVLVIDSDFDDRSLTLAIDSETSQGLADIGKGGNTIEQLIETTSLSGVDVLSVGVNKVANTPQLSTIVRKALSAVGNDYEYIFVNIGEAHSQVAKCWAEFTNGTFLLVNMGTTNREIAKSAVSLLNSYGARLIGCIVSTVDE